jgi:hypothetical protein
MFCDTPQLAAGSFINLSHPFVNDPQMIEHHEHRPITAAVLNAHDSIDQDGEGALLGRDTPG